jgi:hypothetical protein
MPRDGTLPGGRWPVAGGRCKANVIVLQAIYTFSIRTGAVRLR